MIFCNNAVQKRCHLATGAHCGFGTISQSHSFSPPHSLTVFLTLSHSLSFSPPWNQLLTLCPDSRSFSNHSKRWFALTGPFNHTSAQPSPGENCIDNIVVQLEWVYCSADQKESLSKSEGCVQQTHENLKIVPLSLFPLEKNLSPKCNVWKRHLLSSRLIFDEETILGFSFLEVQTFT